MAHANYTVSTYTNTEDTGDSVNAGTIVPSVVLVITPNAGYVVSASVFSIGDPLPIEVSSVVFTDTTTAGQPGNLVHATVTFYNFNMPNADKDIIVDIDGEAQREISANPSISVCLVDNIQSEGFCDDTHWPKSGDPTEPGIPGTCWTCPPVQDGGGPNNSYAQYLVNAGLSGPPEVYGDCQSQFVNTVEGTGIVATTGTNLNWFNPTYNQINTAYTTQHAGSITPSTTTTLFTKTFWTSPGKSYSTTPFYQLNSNALTSGYYTVDETPTNYNVDKTLITSISNSNILTCDTTDILPGMQVTGVTLLSCGDNVHAATYTPPKSGCYPWNFEDIRVISVDHSAGTITITESIETLTSGDILNFSTILNVTSPNGIGTAPLNCLVKQFTVKFNGPTAVSCEEKHEIDFGTESGPYSFSHGSTSSQPKITNVEINTSNISPNGEVRTIVVNGVGNLTFGIKVTRSDGITYNWDTETFSRKLNENYMFEDSILSGQTASTSNPFQKTIIFPETSTYYTYDIEIVPSGGTVLTAIASNDVVVNTRATFASGVSSTYTPKHYPDRELTFASTGSGLTLTSFPSPTGITMPGNSNFENGRSIASWTGTITSATGGKLYNNNTFEPSTFTSDGSFTNATASSGQMLLNITLSGSGGATITATIDGEVYTQPTADTAVTIDLKSFLTGVPNCYNSKGEHSISGAVSNSSVIRVHRELDIANGNNVGIDPDSGFTQDLDSNFYTSGALPAGHKDFYVVSTSGLNHGIIGSNFGVWDDEYFYGDAAGTAPASTEVDKIIYKYNGGGTIGDVETFTYKCNDGSTDSEIRTCTITLTE
jgi:hypothetical protein